MRRRADPSARDIASGTAALRIVGDDFRRATCDRHVRRNVPGYNAPSAYGDVVANDHVLDNADVWSNVDVVAYGRRLAVVRSDRNALRDVAIRPDLRRRIDDDAT